MKLFQSEKVDSEVPEVKIFYDVAKKSERAALLSTILTVTEVVKIEVLLKVINS